MTRKAWILATVVAFCLLTPAAPLQADPIADALKLIRQSAKSSVKKQTFKKVSPTMPVQAIMASAINIQFQEAALILSKRQFTKDSSNPALHHALAMLPNEKEPFSPIRHGFDAMRYWAIVSGDFYWLNHQEKGNGSVLNVAVGDCTGHGVPGALMSILGMSSIQEIYAQDDAYFPNQILNQLRKKITFNLKQTGEFGEQKDGMDLGLIHYFTKERKLEFAGANTAAWVVRGHEIIVLKGDRMPIGIQYGPEQPFTLQSLPLREGDWIYLFTDGFVDQLGGEFGKKYLSKNFKTFLLSIHHLPSQEQKKRIEEEFQRWKKENDQMDFWYLDYTSNN